MRQKPVRETYQSKEIQQIPHISPADGHNYAGRVQNPHRYHKTLQNPTKIKKHKIYNECNTFSNGESIIIHI